MQWIWYLLGLMSSIGIMVFMMVWVGRSNRNPRWIFITLLLALMSLTLCCLMAEPVLSSSPSLWAQALEQKCTWEIRK